MKTNSLILTVLAAAAFIAAGCSKQESSTPTPPPSATPAASVDTSKLTAAFAAAEPALKTAVDTAVTAIKNADYSGALTQLQALLGKFTLTDDAQKAAVVDVIAAVQKCILDTQAKSAAKHAADASKAASDATKALPK